MDYTYSTGQNGLDGWRGFSLFCCFSIGSSCHKGDH